MSVKVISAVWETSRQSGGSLLMLLALADFADDDGNCWPSVAVLGKKARMSERNARYALRNLEDAGEIATVIGGGRHGTTAYRVLAGANIAGGKVEKGGNQQPPANIAPGQDGADKGAEIAPGGGKIIQERGQPIAPEPSLTVREPSLTRQEEQLAPIGAANGSTPDNGGYTGKWHPFYEDCGALWGTTGLRKDGNGPMAWAGSLAQLFGRFAHEDVDEARRLLRSWSKSDEFKFAQQPTLAPPKAGKWLTENAAFFEAVQR